MLAATNINMADEGFDDGYIQRTATVRSNVSNVSYTSTKTLPGMASYTVYLLDGQPVQVQVKRKSIGRELFECVCGQLDTPIDEKYYFSLSFDIMEHKNLRRTWIDFNKPVARQMINAPNKALAMNVKFYPPDPTQLLEYSRYLFYLQLRDDVCKGKMHPMILGTQQVLGSYICQADIGDYEEGENYDFLYDFPFGPGENSSKLVEGIIEIWKGHRGMTTAESEMNYLENAKKLPMYGTDLYPCLDSDEIEIDLGINWSGVLVFKNKTRINRISWPKILKISYKRDYFFIRVRPAEMDKYEKTIGFKMEGYKAAKRVWKICVEHHAFFRLVRPDPKSKKIKFGSKPNLTFDTEYQVKQKSGTLRSQFQTFDRYNTMGSMRSMSLTRNGGQGADDRRALSMEDILGPEHGDGRHEDEYVVQPGPSSGYDNRLPPESESDRKEYLARIDLMNAGESTADQRREFEEPQETQFGGEDRRGRDIDYDRDRYPERGDFDTRGRPRYDENRFMNEGGRISPRESRGDSRFPDDQRFPPHGSRGSPREIRDRHGNLDSPRNQNQEPPRRENRFDANVEMDLTERRLSPEIGNQEGFDDRGVPEFEVHGSMGRPKLPEGYSLPAPESDPRNNQPEDPQGNTKPQKGFLGFMKRRDKSRDKQKPEKEHKEKKSKKKSGKNQEEQSPERIDRDRNPDDYFDPSVDANVKYENPEVRLGRKSSFERLQEQGGMIGPESDSRPQDYEYDPERSLGTLERRERFRDPVEQEDLRPKEFRRRNPEFEDARPRDSRGFNSEFDDVRPRDSRGFNSEFDDARPRDSRNFRPEFDDARPRDSRGLRSEFDDARPRASVGTEFNQTPRQSRSEFPRNYDENILRSSRNDDPMNDLRPRPEMYSDFDMQPKEVSKIEPKLTANAEINIGPRHDRQGSYNNEPVENRNSLNRYQQKYALNDPEGRGSFGGQRFSADIPSDEPLTGNPIGVPRYSREYPENEEEEEGPPRPPEPKKTNLASVNIANEPITSPNFNISNAKPVVPVKPVGVFDRMYKKRNESPPSKTPISDREELARRSMPDIDPDVQTDYQAEPEFPEPPPKLEIKVEERPKSRFNYGGNPSRSTVQPYSSNLNFDAPNSEVANLTRRFDRNPELTVKPKMDPKPTMQSDVDSRFNAQPEVSIKGSNPKLETVKQPSADDNFDILFEKPNFTKSKNDDIFARPAFEDAKKKFFNMPESSAKADVERPSSNVNITRPLSREINAEVLPNVNKAEPARKPPPVVAPKPKKITDDRSWINERKPYVPGSADFGKSSGLPPTDANIIGLCYLFIDSL